jgi:diguanylate cyclase (GGDEF)-like protein/PAS domain S-box-containing protein
MPEITTAQPRGEGVARRFGSRYRSATTTIYSCLSGGSSLPDDVLAQRHRWILALLWCHVPGVFVFAQYRGQSASQSLFAALIVAVWPIAANVCHRRRRLSTVITSMGLMVASAVLVYLSHGSIEMHFHYFVMVGVVTLYQDWLPFIVAIGFVVLQHGIAGAVEPSAVYDHKDAIRNPWGWAAVHGGFILAMSVVGIVSWRLNEALQRRAVERETQLEEAQEVARLGSWELDVATGVVTWSDELFRLLELPRSPSPTLADLLDQVPREERSAFEAAITAARTDGSAHSRDVHIATESGGRWLHLRIRAGDRMDGRIATVSGTAQDVTERKRAEAELSETLSLLTATLDSTADGIFVVDLEGRITSFNHRFREMWSIPDEILESRDDARALACVTEQLVSPDRFLAKVRELYALPEAQSQDTIEFLDGRVFERFSLPQRVEGKTVGRVWSFRDITARVRLEHQLSHQAFHDRLTGLANQALFRDRIEHALARSHRDEALVAVLFIDLDKFKNVNDSLGHTAGDELLVVVADRLRGCLRASDTPARMGGDEFAVLLEDTDSAAEVEEVAQRIITSFAQPWSMAGREVYVSASVGVAFAGPGSSCDQLLRNADLAMYTAKRCGRNRFETYQNEMHTAAVDRMELESALRNGLDRDELAVHYQPIVSLASGQIVGVEALVRWHHPEKGLIEPSAFVPLVEDTGLVIELGRQVLFAACADAKRWQTRHPAHGNLYVSVNVSPRQLQTSVVAPHVRDALQSSGLAPEHLVLEITETAMMRDTESTIEKLKELKSIGAQLAVDDFGTGYSSLSYLQRFPVDILKIDRAFISTIETDTTNVQLAPAIVGLARTLGLKAIAEGVETAEQAEALNALGCELAQGYYYSRPVTAEGLDTLLAKPMLDRARTAQAPMRRGSVSPILTNRPA